MTIMKVIQQYYEQKRHPRFKCFLGLEEKSLDTGIVYNRDELTGYMLIRLFNMFSPKKAYNFYTEVGTIPDFGYSPHEIMEYLYLMAEETPDSKELKEIEELFILTGYCPCQSRWPYHKTSSRG